MKWWTLAPQASQAFTHPGQDHKVCGFIEPNRFPPQILLMANYQLPTKSYKQKEDSQPYNRKKKKNFFLQKILHSGDLSTF